MSNPPQDLPATTRRRFLAASGMAVAAALAADVGTGVTWRRLQQRSVADPARGGEGILVVVTLYGGNDGLSTVIPGADPAYQDARPELAYDPSELLALGEGLGLNPSMKQVHGMWERGDVAVVRGVGYARPDHSHFRSMDIWQTGSPSTPVDTGWLGRWLDTGADDPLRAVAVSPVLPPLVVGQRTAAATLNLDAVSSFSPNVETVLEGLALPDASDVGAMGQVARSTATERRVATTLSGTAGSGSGGSANDASSGLERQLDVVSAAIRMGAPTQAYSVDLGGFDTHADEKSTQAALLGVVDRAVGRFFDSLRDHPRADDVVMMIYSEFGRRVAANASDGTDHGTAGPTFVIGRQVVGGFFGEQPSLTDLDNGDQKSTVDFRSIYAELTDRVLGGDPDRIVPGAPAMLGLLSR